MLELMVYTFIFGVIMMVGALIFEKWDDAREKLIELLER